MHGGDGPSALVNEQNRQAVRGFYRNDRAGRVFEERVTFTHTPGAPPAGRHIAE